MLQRNTRNPLRCIPQSLQDPLPLHASILLVEPFRRTLPDFLLSERSSRLTVLQPTFHLLENIEVVLDVLQGAIVRQGIDQFRHFHLGGLHLSSPRQTAAATRGRWLSDSTFRFMLVIRFFRST